MGTVFLDSHALFCALEDYAIKNCSCRSEDKNQAPLARKLFRITLIIQAHMAFIILLSTQAEFINAGGKVLMLPHLLKG